MKKRFSVMLAFLAAIMLMPHFAEAQMEMLSQPLPLDSAVRVGKLPNGLTYYIQHNDYPKGQADFYIAQKVGSALEQDHQRGLAHFLEHMCFNGTTHFPGDQLLKWLESVGAKFGENVNAYTSIDETVYNLENVPVARESVQDSCLLILHDWANDLLLDSVEIEKERGVIQQEWRSRNVGQQRVLESLTPLIYPTTKYGYRWPIGTMDVVMNFSPKALRDYYEAWYRPDQQGIVVVGDIDVDRIEAKIKEMFSDIEMAADAPERTYEPVPDHKGTLYAIGSDPEISSADMDMMFLYDDPVPKSMRNTPLFYANNYMELMARIMLNNRLSDMAAQPDAPFASANVSLSNYFLAKTKRALDLSATAKDADVLGAFKAAYRELLRAQRGGFTETEYDRAKANYLTGMEHRYNTRSTAENNTFVNKYVRNFIDGNPAPGVETEYEIAKMLAESVPLAAINQNFAKKVTPDNRVVLALLPKKEGYKNPTPEEIEAVVAAVDAETIEPFAEEVRTDPLIPSFRKPGKIKSTKELAQFGATEWTLSNGAKVVVKPTKYKENEILFTALSNKGWASASGITPASIICFDVIDEVSALGTYTAKDLKKYMTGKYASLGIGIDDYATDLSGMSSTKDLETLMELIYGYFTEFAVDESEAEAVRAKYYNMIANQENDPQFQFSKKLYSTLYAAPQKQMVDAQAIKDAKVSEVVDLVKQMTSNAADFTFVFVGDVNLDVLRPLVEKYIASLPGKAAKKPAPVVFDPANGFRTGSSTDITKMDMQTPQSFAAIIVDGQLPYTSKNRQISSIAGQVLTKRLLEKIREEMGAVYSIGAQGQMARMAEPNTLMLSAFPLKPDMQDQVLAEIHTQFENLAKEIKPEELASVKEFMAKEFKEQAEKNGGWLGGIGGFYRNGVDTFNGALETLESITADDVEAFVKELLGQGNYNVMVIEPSVIETPAGTPAAAPAE